MSSANYFNQAQTALKRIGEQIRFKIPELNHLDLILQEDAWIVVDRVLDDLYRSLPGPTSKPKDAITCTSRCPAKFASITLQHA